MTTGLIGRKIGMTQVFSKEGHLVPVTVVKAGPCCVVQKKTSDRDGYNAVQLGFDTKKTKKITKPLQGHLKPTGGKAFAVLREMKVTDVDTYEAGQEITLSIFTAGDRVKVSGTSKGKGFAGVVKRWGFRGGPATHGSMFHRAPGSIGASADPSRVFKGRKMPGHMGTQTVTAKNVTVIEVREKENLLLLKGAIPGASGSIITIYRQ